MRPEVVHFSTLENRVEAILTEETPQALGETLSTSTHLQVVKLVKTSPSKRTFLVRSTQDELTPLASYRNLGTSSNEISLSSFQPQSLTESNLKIAEVYDHQNITSLKTLNQEVTIRGLLMKYPQYFEQCFGFSTKAEPLVFTDDSEQVYSYIDGSTTVFLEYFQNGNFLDYILTSHNDFTDQSQISKMFLKTCECVNVLHTDLNLSHLSLRLSKIKLDGKLRPKLSSFS